MCLRLVGEGVLAPEYGPLIRIARRGDADDYPDYSSSENEDDSGEEGEELQDEDEEMGEQMTDLDLDERGEAPDM